MSDPTKLSDAELLAALNGPAQSAPVSSMSDADLLKALGQQPSVTEDVAKSAGSGVVRGLTSIAGLPADLAKLLGSGADAAAEWITGEKIPEAVKRNPVADVLGSASINRGVDALAGAPVTSYKPQTTAGEYARTVGEFLPGALAGPGGVARKAIGYGVVPGLASEAAGQATEGSAIEPYARVAAALAGTMAPGALTRAITPLPVSPERKAIIDALTKEGVPLTAGQKTGSKPLLYAESILGDAPGAGGKASAVMGQQAEAFTEAAMRRGGGSGMATPENMAAMDSRLSQGFRDVSARNAITPDQGLVDDIVGTVREYNKVINSEQRRAVGNITGDIIGTIDQYGTIPGEIYQSTRSRLSRMAKSTTDTEYARALRGLRDALDKGMARSVSPEDAQTWARLRREYGNMKVLEQAATGAGSEAAMGTISPAKLRQAAVGSNRSGYAKGQGDFAELARSGAALMTPLPNSGTAQRSMMIGGGGGAAGAMATGNLPLAAALLAGPGIAGRALYSRPVQSWLGNQALAGASTPAMEKIAQALLAGRSATLPASQ